jgi:hypothetical protein
MKAESMDGRKSVMKNETWFEFMDRAKKNGLSPTKQMEIDRDAFKKIHDDDVKKNMLYKSFYEENRVSVLQYNSLRNHFRKMIDDVLGKNYYNMGADVYESDRLCCEDITREANRGFFDRLFK